jgi:hypothetical protein
VNDAPSDHPSAGNHTATMFDVLTDERG